VAEFFGHCRPCIGRHKLARPLQCRMSSTTRGAPTLRDAVSALAAGSKAADSTGRTGGSAVASATAADRAASGRSAEGG
jgi:hypothetical protein